MIRYGGVRHAVTALSPDGPVTVLPTAEWIRQTIATMRYAALPEDRAEASEFIDWENEFFSWTREAQEPIA